MEYGNDFDFFIRSSGWSDNEQQWIRYIFSDHDRLSVGDRGSRDDWYCEICI